LRRRASAALAAHALRRARSWLATCQRVTALPARHGVHGKSCIVISCPSRSWPRLGPSYDACVNDV
jgi:hypothetical protein